MQRMPHKSSSQQSLIILILIILIIIAVATNIILAWFYSRTSSSRIEINGNVKVVASVLNGQTLKFDDDELFPGNVIDRTILIQKDSEAENFYLRLKSEIRIDGIKTSSIDFRIAQEDDDKFILEDAVSAEWYYCYSDYNTWKSQSDYNKSRIHIQFVIPQSMSEERLSHIITTIIYIEVVPVTGSVAHWQNLPSGWPYIEEENLEETQNEDLLIQE